MRHYKRLDSAQKAAVAAGSALGALIRPARADLVAALGETTGERALEAVLRRMKQSSSGKRILQDKPRLTNALIERCRQLPSGTLGSEYARFMLDRNFSPEERPPVRFIADEQVAYAACRLREIHDIWHVLFKCGTNIYGEAALKWIEMMQTGMPMTALSAGEIAVGGPLRFKTWEEQQRFVRQVIPWAVSAGSQCHDLSVIYYEEHFESGIDDVRKLWGIRPLPSG